MIKNYKEYLKEKLIVKGNLYNPDLEKLLSILPKVKEQYDLNYGGCAVFAKIIAEIFNHYEFAYVFYRDQLEDEPPYHILLIINNKYLDVDGIKSKKQVIQEYKYNDEYPDSEPYILEDTGDMLEVYYDELGSGIFTTDFKPQYDEIKNYILKLLK
jgi:hypothetical protein